MSSLPVGIYEKVLDEELQELLDQHPDLKPILRKLDDEEVPQVYAQFVGNLLSRALHVAKKDERLSIINRVLDLLAASDGLDYVKRHTLLSTNKNLLTEIRQSDRQHVRPETPLSTSALLTGQGIDPPLEHELRAEMLSADRVDILISFIKWSGLRLLQPAFERLAQDGIPVRIISTSYMGASDPAALEWLAKQENVEIKVSYDTGGTRLHAKAYHFIRKSGYSTAYIGSANMSHSAMTQGLEWTVKVTGQDMPHILDRFVADFSTYWESPEFEEFTEVDFSRFRKAINNFKKRALDRPVFFADITARPFQERILDSLAAARQGGSARNLVVAATGTGKTVVSALDYKRHSEIVGKRERLLFVVHRKEILEQAMFCFRTVLRDQNFGELLVDGNEPTEWNHVFASVQSLGSRKPWQKMGKDHFRFVIVDEAHHGAASSYRPLFDHLKPEILLGLTATPERMDGSAILPDFDGRFAAEIRLPEALEEKLLCPFHYFGVTDNIDLDEDRFWRNGKYDQSELDKVYTGDDIRAKQRVDLILQAVQKYQPDLTGVKAVGFCASKKHATFMSDHFNRAGIASEVLISGSNQSSLREEKLQALRSGEITFLFAVDILNEGVDIPDINMVLFLRPTESLTVFLQQLGRGLRHAPEKDCLTVLDFVGQTHRKYRLDTKFAALLSRKRHRIDREIENDFPNLPAGCSIILERVAREKVLDKIKSVLSDLQHFIPETIKTWDRDVAGSLSFENFILATGLSAIEVLRKKTWSEWKAMAGKVPVPNDPDQKAVRNALLRLSLRTDPALLDSVENISKNGKVSEGIAEYRVSHNTALHYLFWGQKGENVGVKSFEESFEKWLSNDSVADSLEIAEWKKRNQPYPIEDIKLPFPCMLKLHAAYGSHDIKAALGLSSLEKSGSTGVGVFHNKDRKVYAHLVTFRKVEEDFSPTTLYKDYPISRNQMHWESQSIATQKSATGQNYIHFKKRGYTILFFARVEKQIEGVTAPFIYLGPASELLSYDGDRPISMVWELEHKMPAALFEDARPS